MKQNRSNPIATCQPKQPDRIPRETIRLRYGKRMLRHGLALGWRAEWDGDPFPVTVTRIVDAIVAVGTETTVTHYVSVRCGKCRTEFNTSANFRTAACKRCGRVCRLDLADRIPDALPSNVIPIARSRAS